MTVENDLTSIYNDMEDIQLRFVKSGQNQYLKTGDQANFKRLAIETKALLDQRLGYTNDFSMNLVSSVNAGSGGFFGDPSYAAVGEAAQVIKGALNHIRRLPLAAKANPFTTSLKPPYVDPSRLAHIRSLPSTRWDLARLAQMCGELNVAHDNECHIAVAVLVRAILDHIPPIFGKTSFSEAANGMPKSIKGSMLQLETSLRNIADTHLHLQVRKREAIPNAAQVNFSAALDVVLAEIVRLMEENP